ncbi:hypothetical protein Btru_008077 [Bulinus truncatus]|nr:hypothetical protein Btru_008077 [Bulinus truncatus]
MTFDLTTAIMSNMSVMSNSSIVFFDPFRQPSLKVVVIVLYVAVFFLCVIGNIIVLYVLTRNTQISSRTNLFLANLAVADLCVGIFCVLPSMVRLVADQWYFGNVLCKFSKFIENMNLTTSMLLLEVIAVERYIAINYPLKARHLFSQYKLYFAQAVIWCVSCAYNVPHFFYMNAHEYTLDNVTRVSCSPSGSYAEFLYIYYVCTFVAWYVVPLCVMSVLYAKISRTLWKSSIPSHMMMKLRKRMSSVASSNMSEETVETTTSSLAPRQTSDFATQPAAHAPKEDTAGSQLKENLVNGYQVKMDRKRDSTQANGGKFSFSTRYGFRGLIRMEGGRINSGQKSSSLSTNSSDSEDHANRSGDVNAPFSQNASVTGKLLRRDSFVTNLPGPPERKHPPTPVSTSHYRVTSQRATSRRRVIRLLLVILVAFALLILPNHIRLILYYKVNIPLTKVRPFITPICHFLMYLNSAVNPILYSLMSQSFRRFLKDSIVCCLRKK